MRFRITLLFLFCQFVVFSQEEIYFFKDADNVLSLSDVKKEKFSVLKDDIREGYDNATYWFKVPADNTDSVYIFKFLYDRYHEADLYQDTLKLDRITNQRYLSYQFSKKYDLYVKIKPKLHSYIPIEVKKLGASFYKDKKNLLFNGFYYGFSFLIILYNLIFFFLFKDKVFIYYSFFQATLCFGIFTMDGMLNFYNIFGNLNEFLMVANYLLMAFFSSKFAVSYLFLDTYFPRLKRLTFIFGVSIVVTAILYLIFKNYYYLLGLNLFVFSLITLYWICGILLFNKNFYTKIVVIADAIILISAIDFFVLKFLGISIIDIDAVSIKIGAFIEMIILSIAVLYRMDVLIKENSFMKNEIIKYSENLTNKSNSAEENKRRFIDDLSLREKEIFDLIVLSKTNKEIANELNISINTVKFHVKNIYEKLNIKSRKEAVLLEKV